MTKLIQSTLLAAALAGFFAGSAQALPFDPMPAFDRSSPRRRNRSRPRR